MGALHTYAMRMTSCARICRAVFLCLGTLVSAMLNLIAAEEPKPEGSRPNILFCIADDWSYPHAGAYGDPVVKTPTFDRVAREGVRFTHAFCAAPSCSPSRAAILTGQAPHRLEAGGNLWGFLPSKFKVYPDLLEQAGYVVGLMRKGWGPGSLEAGGWKRNPAGPTFKNFAEFFKTVPSGQPFCFWFGSPDPHRPYVNGSGLKSGLKPENVAVPSWLPDTPEIRSYILDYYFEVERFDREVGEVLKILEAVGQLDNTLVVITSDNGMPFPRAKTNLHDSGSRMPLAIRWPARFQGGRTLDTLVSLTDMAPTFLEAAGLQPLAEMTGKSLLSLLTGQENPATRNQVFIERERHANKRKGDLSYPVRALRTKDFLYVRNLRPERWPGGDPEKWVAVGEYGDCDNSPSKESVLAHRDEPIAAKAFQLAFAKRPPDELYDLSKDPHQVHNVAGWPEYAAIQTKLRATLDRWMRETKDPRADGGGDEFDRYPYFGDAKRMPVREGGK